jgi:FMN phosphatase YigB (HAD superfamily)
MATRAVCFDVGGVLARIVRTWGEAADHTGIVIAEAARSVPHATGFEPHLQYQRGEIDESAYLEALRAFLEVGSVEDALRVHNGILLEAYPGTLELVLELQRVGVTTASLSNTNAPHFARMLDPELFPAIVALDFKVASHEVQSEKPNPEIYRILERTIGAQGSEIVFFDDSVKNVEAAGLVGWHAYWIDPAGSPATQVREHLVSEGVLSV